VVLALGACGHPAARPAPVLTPALPRLASPLPVDPAARGAAYLNQLALQLEPGWGQFLDDCRLRLGKTHPLNQMTLAATAQFLVDAQGRTSALEITSSGNQDFDQAVRDAIADADPLAPPPADLMSDDDHVHLRWLFARDRRQAGPATAAVIDVDLPVGDVVERLVGRGDLARAALRIRRAPPGDARTAATLRVMTAALREALSSADGATRRAAVDAIGRAGIKALVPDVRGLLESTIDTELRLVAISTALALEDRDACPQLTKQLAVDLVDHPRLAPAEARALVALGHAADVAASLVQMLAHADPPNPIALQVLAFAPTPALAGRLPGWLHHRDARVRAGACAALAGQPSWPLVAEGLRDPDASVRTACIDTVHARAADPKVATALPRVRALVHDRDRTVRAHALAALVVLDAPHLVSAVDDPASEVRAAFASALATALPSEAQADLRTLIDDRDPEVRAAAWTSLVALAAAPADRATLALHAVRDAAPQVRLAALPAVDDDQALAQVAATDDSPDVRTSAIVLLAGRRGRAAIETDLLGRLAAAPTATAERVRIALAWLLAR